MNHEITKEETTLRLEHAIRTFEWIKEFLGVNKEEFLVRYRSLHAQLRDGDRLAIEVRKDIVQIPHSYGTKVALPCFDIVFYTAEGKREVLYTINNYSNVGKMYIVRGLLYEQ